MRSWKRKVREEADGQSKNSKNCVNTDIPMLQEAGKEEGMEPMAKKTTQSGDGHMEEADGGREATGPGATGNLSGANESAR